MKVTDGRRILNVSPKTWELIKGQGIWREVDDTTLRVAIPTEVVDFMQSKRKVEIPKDIIKDERLEIQALLEKAGIEYDKRLGVKKLKELYDNKKQENGG